jgi:hypothetical protein
VTLIGQGSGGEAPDVDVVFDEDDVGHLPEVKGARSFATLRRC